MDNFLTVDLPALIVAILVSLICALLGNFLILRKQAMMSDALSHVVLPGLVVGFMIAGSLSTFATMLGALGACLLSVFCIAILSRIRILERSAVIGIVFTFMFALGLVVLEIGVGARVHLDAHHVLYGALELTYWSPPHSWSTLPAQIKTLAILLFIVIAFMTLYYRALLLSSFDIIFTKSIGIKDKVLETSLMICTALALVACFDAVGSILVVSLFVTPPATARLLSESLTAQIRISLFFAVLSAISGYYGAIALPNVFGFTHSLSTGGMVALASGLYFVSALIFTQKTRYFS